MTTDVKRLHPSLGDTWGMRVSDDGEYVAYKDYAAAIADRDAARAECKTWLAKCHELNDAGVQVVKDLAAAQRECERLKTRLLTAAGDDLCRLTQEEIKELSSGAVKIPPKDEFLASCERFHAQIASEAGVMDNCLTLAQLVAENEKLTSEVERLKAACKAGDVIRSQLYLALEIELPKYSEEVDRLSRERTDLAKEVERLTRQLTMMVELQKDGQAVLLAAQLKQANEILSARLSASESAVRRLTLDANDLVSLDESRVAEITSLKADVERLKEECQQRAREIENLSSFSDRAISQIKVLQAELKLWKPMTPEEAEAALATVEAQPLSDEEVDKIIAKITDPANRPTEPEHIQLVAKVRQLRRQLKANDAAWSKAAVAAIQTHEQRKARLSEAVALLRRWELSDCEDVQSKLHDEVQAFLATIDAEAKD